MTTDKTLYNLLSEPDKKYPVRQDIFVNNHECINGNLVFNTVGYYTKAFTHAFRMYIPFSQYGDLINDYNNGVYTVYPLYHILVINAPIISDPNSYGIYGVYPMNTVHFEEVYLDDDLNPVPANKAEDLAAIKRLEPKSLEPTKSMLTFFDDLKNGNIKINFAV